MSLKRKKFIELAENRVNKALKDIQLIGNLSNKGAYDFTDEDLRKIIKALDREMASLKERFKIGQRVDEKKFSLED
ncbi:MAG: hypothetical protein DI628_01825 [Blastochloris viridis]|uniref:Uncharacterized protein n=1 Tax=Blastochloris viridis TaxID=1079 RepID=A0A6N4RDL4_BLAVI|nr:MAG: hypothetical protein DI628_01825 [Blastochloris viridis]